MDLIERQAAIRWVKTECNPYGKPTLDYESGKRVMKHLELMPSSQPEQQWIPCSERLPEVHESGNSFSGIYMQSVPVLVYGICEGEENAQFHVVTYCDDLDGNTYWSTALDAVTITGVIAWMPLPEPYKEDDHETD